MTAAPTETEWFADPHTLAKHVVLKHYLEAWFPILSKGYGRIVFYDGFAGPGAYAGGEEGSPLIALNVARRHRAAINSKLVFIFVENKPKRAAKLEERLGSLDLPSNFKWEVRCLDFADALGTTLDQLDADGLQIAPTFAFVDPFGITGLPFSLIRRLLQRPQCEVLITFMTSTIRRFVTELSDQVNDLIGDSDAATKIASEKDRVIAARRLYEASLGQAADFVRFFQMRDQNHQPIYDLFFASNHELGHYKMKEAMWKADGTGTYSFSDGTDPQQALLFSPNPERDYASILWRHFRGKTVDAKEVLRYTRNKTPFLEQHGRAAMTLLEGEEGYESKRITVAETKADRTPRRKNTFPKGALVTFERR